MKLDAGSYLKYNHYPSQLDDDVLRKTCFQNLLTKDQQVLEVGCGTGHFARPYLLRHCQPCREIVATDLPPDMVEAAKEHFSHKDIVHDVLDITTANLTPFLEMYGTFDRVFSFLVFHMIRDQKAAYANIAKLLKHDVQCLVAAYSSFDFADVLQAVYKTPK